MENTLTGKKSVEIKHISVSFRQHEKNFRSYLLTLDRSDKAKKTISRYCPFNSSREFRDTVPERFYAAKTSVHVRNL
jgi:hypothetical protein